MTNSVPALLGVLLLVVLSTPAVAFTPAGATAATVSSEEPSLAAAASSVDEPESGDHFEVNNTTNRLALDRDGANASSLATPSSDLGAVFASQDGSLRYDFEWYTFDESFEELNASERENATMDALDEIDDRLETLHDREQETVEAHAAGEASDEELFRVLAQNYEEARDLERAIDRVLDRGDGYVDDRSVGTSQYRVNHEIYTSSIREAVAEAVAGDELGANVLFTVETTEDGLSLARVDSGEYVRETTRYDNRDHLLSDRIGSLGEARDLAEESYPFASDTSSGTSSHASPVKLYRVGFSHAQGDLSVYLDGATESVYHERQDLVLSELPIEDERTWTSDSLNVTVAETPADGPKLVTVTDEDGEPVNASVAVDGVELDETGYDGELWIAPPTDADEVTVETDDDRVNATLVDD